MCIFENFTNFLHSPTYKPRERRFFNPQRKLFWNSSYYPKDIGTEKYRRFEKVFHLLEKKRGLVRYFLNKFLSIREKERISHPVFMKVL